MDDKWKTNIYKGMDAAFWRGYNADEDMEVLCFIEEGLDHRYNSHSLIERAYIKKEEVDAYMQNKVFMMCPMHPSKQAEPFTLKLTGDEPRINY